MTSQSDVNEFLKEKNLAVVGVSRKGKKFGNIAFNTLQRKGYRVFPVNKSAEAIDGAVYFNGLNTLPEPVGGVLIVVPPEQTMKVVLDAADAGIRKVWMQQGAESDEAVRFCNEHGIMCIHGECILMFANPSGFPHGAHRWLWKVLGKLPQ
ncbi:MAG: CoA-binding protein [Calditrichaceae bacterium]